MGFSLISAAEVAFHCVVSFCSKSEPEEEDDSGNTVKGSPTFSLKSLTKRAARRRRHRQRQNELKNATIPTCGAENGTGGILRNRFKVGNNVYDCPTTISEEDDTNNIVVQFEEIMTPLPIINYDNYANETGATTTIHQQNSAQMRAGGGGPAAASGIKEHADVSTVFTFFILPS